MEAFISNDGGRGILQLGGPPHGLIGLAHPSHVLGSQTLDRSPQREQFQGFDNGVDFRGLADVDGRHACPTVQGSFDQAFILQAAQCLPDGSPAHPHCGRNVLIPEEFPRPEPAVDNPGAKTTVNFFTGESP